MRTREAIQNDDTLSVHGKLLELLFDLRDLCAGIHEESKSTTALCREAMINSFEAVTNVRAIVGEKAPAAAAGRFHYSIEGNRVTGVCEIHGAKSFNLARIRPGGTLSIACNECLAEKADKEGGTDANPSGT